MGCLAGIRWLVVVAWSLDDDFVVRGFGLWVVRWLPCLCLEWFGRLVVIIVGLLCLLAFSVYSAFDCGFAFLRSLLLGIVGMRLVFGFTLGWIFVV